MNPKMVIMNGQTYVVGPQNNMIPVMNPDVISQLNQSIIARGGGQPTILQHNIGSGKFWYLVETKMC